MKMTEQEALDYVNENDVKFIRLAIVDLFGTLKNISIMPSELPRAFGGGISFDAAAVKGFCDVTDSDLFLLPDPGTLSILPWRPQTGRVIRMICDCRTPQGQPFEAYSRTVLMRQVEKACQKGYHFMLGTEYEFYLFKANDEGEMTLIPQDDAGYMDVSPLDKGENIRRELCLNLEEMHIDPEASHHEQGPGQNEIDFHYASPLTAADNALAFKSAVRTIAAQYGLCASFMPKPLENESGNGLHVNLSIIKEGVNLFEQVDGKLTKEAQHAMAGILKYIREMSLFLNPVPSSYSRLGCCEAPGTVSWSYGNRSRLIRIPASIQGAGRMELRSPDPSCNPYLAFALILAAAMEGITKELPLQSAMDEQGKLPHDLKEAISLAENSAFLRDVLPESLLEKYLQEKRTLWTRVQADARAVFEQHLRTI